MTNEEELKLRMQALLRSTARASVSPGRGRDTSSRYAELLQIVATVFLLDPVAYGHIVSTACRRLEVLVSSLLEQQAELAVAVGYTWLRDIPMEDLSALDTAARGLRALSSASALATHSGYKTFNTAVDTFLEQQKLNLVHAGTLRTSSAQARADIARLLVSTADSMLTIRGLLDVLLAFPAAYGDIDLGRMAADNAIQESALTLSKWLLTLDSLTPSERPTVLRDMVMDLIATRTVLSSLSTVHAHGAFYEKATKLTAMLDKAATPATIVGSVSGPFAVPTELSLTVTVDYNDPVVVPVGVAGYPYLLTQGHNIVGEASVTGTATGPFYIGYTALLYLYTLDVDDDRYLITTVTLTPGSYTTDALVTAVNDRLTAVGLDTQYEASNVGGALKLEALGIDGRVAVGGGYITDFLGLPAYGWFIHGALVPYLAARTAGTYNTTTASALDLVVYDTKASVEVLVRVTLTSSATLSAATAATDIQNALNAAGVGTQYTASGATSALVLTGSSVYGYIRCADSTALAVFGWTAGYIAKGATSNTSLRLVVEGNTNSPYIVSLAAGAYTAHTLAAALSAEVVIFDGDFGFEVRGTAEQAYTIIRYYGVFNAPAGYDATLYLDYDNSSAAVTIGWVAGQTAYGGKVPARQLAVQLDAALSTWSVLVRRVFDSNLEDVLVVPSLARSDKVTLLRVPAQDATAASTGGVTGTLADLPEGIYAGDSVVFTSGANTGTVWTVLSSNEDGTYNITGSVGLLDGTGSVLVGPTFSSPTNKVLEIYGGPNRGVYDVASAGADPSTLLLVQPLPTPGIGGVAQTAQGGVGQDYLQARSRSTTASSYLRIQGGSSLFGSSPVTAYAAREWFELDERVPGLRVGDELSLRANDPYVESSTCEVVEVVDKAVRLSPGLQNTDTLPLRATSAPTGYLLNTTFRQVRVLMEGLQGWLSTATSLTEGYYRELTRRLNLLNAQVPATRATVNSLQSWLATATEDLVALRDILGSMPLVLSSKMRSVVLALRTRGADRAVDLLLSGDVSRFFGTSEGNASYSTAVRTQLAAAAALAPDTGKNAYKSILQHTIEGTDPEYDLSDTELPDTPSAPANLSQKGLVDPSKVG